MNKATTTVLGLLFAVVLGVPLLIHLAKGSTGSDAELTLVIITPHNENIRAEYALGFNRWRAEQGLAPVGFDWRASGGTSDLRRGVLSQFEGLMGSANTEEEALTLAEEGIGVDLFFGGGAYDHNKLADGADPDGRAGPIGKISVAWPIRLPQGMLGEALPDRFAFGSGKTEQLYRTNTKGDPLWIGTALSSFGIAYNNDAMSAMGMEPPTNWDDLADPRLVGMVALANPSHSGSIRNTYNISVQRQGWTQGLKVLRGVFANARYFANSSTKIPIDIASRDAAAGLCIDFYGRFQAGSIRADAGRVGYLDPVREDPITGRLASMTATTPDPVTLLKGAPHRDVAEQFVAYVLSIEGQKLWQLAPGTEGGPQEYALRRQPIRPDLYEDKTDWTDPAINPYLTASPMPIGTPDYFGIMSTLTDAMAIDLHRELVAAWVALHEARAANHPQLDEIEAAFFALPEALTLTWPDPSLEQDWYVAQNDPDHPQHQAVLDTLKAFGQSLRGLGSDADRKEWRGFFREQYRLTIELAGS